MPYIIFIRHGKKEYKNNKGPLGKPKQDPGLDKSMTNEFIAEKVSKYFNLYGNPTKIISSPFLRTRQTSLKIKNFLNNNTEIIIDKDIEEFLGFQKPEGKIADLDKETFLYTEPILGLEKYNHISKRIVKFYNKIKDTKENLLVVTHGVLIFNLAKYLNIDIKHVKELEGIIIKDDKFFKIDF